jgi:ribosomal protein S1
VAQPRGKKDKKSLRQVEARSRKRIEKLEIGRVYSGIVVKVLESGVLVDIGKVWGKLDARLMMGQLVPVKVVSIDMSRKNRSHVGLVQHVFLKKED